VSGFVIERSGLLTTVQDAGRWGWQHLGVSVSGWMDDWSPRLANRLVGNHDEAAVLEFTLTGPTLRADRDLVVAVTGAVFDVAAGATRLRSPCRAVLRAGETLAVERRHRGARGYVACAGGLAMCAVLGSQSSDLRAGLGAGRLERGHRCEVAESALPVGEVSTVALPAPDWLFEGRLGVMAGPEDARWTRVALATLCQAAYSVSSASNRTGYRLEGPALPAPSGALVSGPVGTGVLQVPPSGLPILLMAESQTTGGYARLGAIAAADRAVAGQRAPGDGVTFREVTGEQAARVAAERRACLEQMVESAR
jgi:antagonist of KipI